ncbi:MAG: adenosylcobinamide-GDP ribazoletransferase [Nitrospirae bacterium]|nr:adenosylcobinamide-GDP ribazoletransferase [Nitrospirota bacterium]
MRQLLLAFQFLTIFPVKVRGEVSEKDIAGSAAFFPVVGALQGLLIAVAGILLMRLFSPAPVSGIIIVILIVNNGGFHLDGLADTFDALAVKSTGDAALDREKRLSVMKDSSTGAIGVTAIAVSLLLKQLLISDLLFHAASFASYQLLFLMPVFSKWVMVPGMFHGISARTDGLGRIFINATGTKTVLASSVSVILLCLLTLPFYPDKADLHKTAVLFPVLFAVLYIFSFSTVKFFTSRFGGITGDNLGAVSEISEILFLMLVSIWLRHSI